MLSLEISTHYIDPARFALVTIHAWNSCSGFSELFRKEEEKPPPKNPLN